MAIIEIKSDEVLAVANAIAILERAYNLSAVAAIEWLHDHPEDLTGLRQNLPGIGARRILRNAIRHLQKRIPEATTTDCGAI